MLQLFCKGFYVDWEYLALDKMMNYLRYLGPIAVFVYWTDCMANWRGVKYIGKYLIFFVFFYKIINLVFQLYRRCLSWASIYEQFFIPSGQLVEGHIMMVIGFGTEIINGQPIPYWLIQKSHIWPKLGP
jgi:hypothetical protein